MPVVLMSSPALKQGGEDAWVSLRRPGWELRWEHFWPARPEEELMRALQGVHGVIASVETYSPRVLDAATNLKVISRSGVGYDAIDVDAATARGIVVCTSVGSNDDTVADFAITLMLALSRDLFRGHAEVRAGGWTRPLARDFYGGTVGIVGMGAIGKKLTRRLGGFGCRVLASDVFQDQEFAAQHGVRYVELDELLQQSDYVSLHAPLLPSTRGLIGEDQLRMMKPTAYLVNTARGPLIQEQALYKALRERWIAGAGIDVFQQEPPSGSPLLDPSLDTIILGPHMAGVTAEANARSARMACESVAHILGADAPLHNVVNPEVLKR